MAKNRQPVLKRCKALGLSPAAALGNGTAVVVTLMLAILMTFLAGVLPGNRLHRLYA